MQEMSEMRHYNHRVASQNGFELNFVNTASLRNLVLYEGMPNI